MNMNNQYFLKGLLFAIIGIILLLGGIRIFSFFIMFMYILAAILIYNGYRLVRYGSDAFTGKLLMIAGGILILVYSRLSIEIILSVICLGVGFYFIFIKSKMFTKDKGVFKDSRSSVIIKEIFSNIGINLVSQSLKSIRVTSIVSQINLDLSYAYIQGDDLVNFNIDAYLSDIKINTSSYCNVLLNGKYVRKIEGVGKTININCKNFLSVIDII